MRLLTVIWRRPYLLLLPNQAVCSRHSPQQPTSVYPLTLILWLTSQPCLSQVPLRHAQEWVGMDPKSWPGRGSMLLAAFFPFSLHPPLPAPNCMCECVMCWNKHSRAFEREEWAAVSKLAACKLEASLGWPAWAPYVSSSEEICDVLDHLSSGTLMNRDSLAALAIGLWGKWHMSNQTQRNSRWDLRNCNIQPFWKDWKVGIKLHFFSHSAVSTTKLLIWGYVQRHTVSAAAQCWSTSSHPAKSRCYKCVRYSKKGCKRLRWRVWGVWGWQNEGISC